MIEPAKINRDLAIAFDGWETSEEPYPFDVTPNDYFHSDALAIELLEKACDDKKITHYFFSRLSDDTYECSVTGVIGNTMQRIGASDYECSAAKAISLALHAAGRKLGLIKVDV